MLDPLSVSISLPSKPATENAPVHPIRKLLRPSTSHPDDYIMELDYSTISSFLECQRKFENHAIRSREAARDGSAVAFGGLFHKLAESRLRGQPIETQFSMIETHFLYNPPPVNDHRTGDRMVSVWKSYRERYDEDGWINKVYTDADGPFIERPFKVELATVEVNGWIPYDPLMIRSVLTETLSETKTFLERTKLENKELFIRNLHILYTGRIDLILTEPPMLWIVDYKTSSRGGREFEEAFRLSLQTRGYANNGQKVTGKQVTGLIMDAVVIRPLTRTGTGTEFNRHTYFYSQDSLDEWAECVRDICSDIVASLLRGRFPQYAKSFKSPCSGCDYHENCALPRAQRAADLASDLYRDVRWSPMHD